MSEMTSKRARTEITTSSSSSSSSSSSFVASYLPSSVALFDPLVPRHLAYSEMYICVILCVVLFFFIIFFSSVWLLLGLRVVSL